MSSDEIRWIRHLKRLAAERPDECVIIKEPEDNDGFIYCKFPQKWARVKPPKQVVMSDKRRADLRKKLEEYRKTAQEKRNEHNETDES